MWLSDKISRSLATSDNAGKVSTVSDILVSLGFKELQKKYSVYNDKGEVAR